MTNVGSCQHERPYTPQSRADNHMSTYRRFRYTRDIENTIKVDLLQALYADWFAGLS
jgi:hypothetical protein